MKSYIRFLLLRIFGIKEKRKDIRTVFRRGTMVKWYTEDFSFNEWIQYIHVKIRQIQ